jgi:NAD(P)-dependent dehydrogenase (short-subunit alcohol dehydrogenase family)
VGFSGDIENTAQGLDGNQGDRMGWNTADIPDQQGRVAIVTGANSGIGFETAKALAEKGAHVLLACRNPVKAEQAIVAIQSCSPHAQCSVGILDLSCLSSVRAFAEQTLAQHDQIDLLINNAGIMIPPFRLTEDGVESQFATNHLGHFALTGLLLPRLLSQGGSRVVTVSSNAHRFGKMKFTDLNRTTPYVAWQAYGQSKLANLLFAYELDRRLQASGCSTASIAAHPGYASTQITQNSGWMQMATDRVAQSAYAGALPTLRAATDPEATGGSFWGPKHFRQMMGPPVSVSSTKRSHNADDAKRLWGVSEEMSGVQFPL